MLLQIVESTDHFSSWQMIGQKAAEVSLWHFGELPHMDWVKNTFFLHILGKS